METKKNNSKYKFSGSFDLSYMKHLNTQADHQSLVSFDGKIEGSVVG